MTILFERTPEFVPSLIMAVFSDHHLYSGTLIDQILQISVSEPAFKERCYKL